MARVVFPTATTTRAHATQLAARPRVPPRNAAEMRNENVAARHHKGRSSTSSQGPASPPTSRVISPRSGTISKLATSTVCRTGLLLRALSQGADGEGRAGRAHSPVPDGVWDPRLKDAEEVK